MVQYEAQAREGWEGWPDRASPARPGERVRGTEPPPRLRVQAYLFCTGSQHLERAHVVAEAAGSLQEACSFKFITL